MGKYAQKSIWGTFSNSFREAEILERNDYYVTGAAKHMQNIATLVNF